MTDLVRVRWRARHAGVAVLRHGTRLVHPMTLARFTGAVWRGGRRSVGALVTYIRASDLADLRIKSPERHLEVRRDRHRIVWVATAVTGAAVAVLVTRWPVAIWLLSGLMLVVLFGLGRKGKVLADPIKLDAAPMELVVRQAFVDAKLAKEIGHVQLKSPVARDKRAWHAEVEMPSGQTRRKALTRRPELASALDVGVIQLDLLEVKGNERRVQVWCCYDDPWSLPPVASPLVSKLKPFDLWRPVPLGEDARGHEVGLPLVFSGVLIGGLPRQGKTVSANNLLVAAMLDVHCRIRLADGKGLDSAPVVPLAHRVADEDPESLVDLLDEMTEDMYVRIRRLKQLGLVKLNREVCRAEMPLDLLWVDELSVFTANPDPKMAKACTAKLRTLASVGPATGIIPLLCTQRPSATVVDPDLRDNIPTRLGLRCATWQTSNTVLGDGAAARGANAAELGDEHKGVGILMQGPNFRTIRSYFVDVEDLQKAAQFARNLRQAAGVLPTPGGRAVPPLLAAMHSAMLAGEGVDRMPTAALLDVLQRANSAEWIDLDATKLADLVRPYGLGPKQLGGPSNPRGYRLDDLQSAINRTTAR